MHTLFHHAELRTESPWSHSFCWIFFPVPLTFLSFSCCSVLYFLSTTGSDDKCDKYLQTIEFHHKAFVAALPEAWQTRQAWPLEEQVTLC